MKKLIIFLLILALSTGCALSKGREKVVISGVIKDYEQYDRITAVYVREVMIVPFPKNFFMMSPYRPVGKIPVQSNGEFMGNVFVCGQFLVSFPGYSTRFFEPNVKEIYIEIDLAKEGYFSENYESDLAYAIDEELYQEYAQVASAYENPQDVPCYPDFGY